MMMIFVQIIFILLTIVFLPVVLLLYSVQSHHPLFLLGKYTLLSLGGVLTGMGAASLSAGVSVFIFLLITTEIIHSHRFLLIKKVEGTKKRFVYGTIRTTDEKNKLFSMDLIISLWLVYFIINQPFPIVVKDKKKKSDINVKEIAKQILELGGESNVDIESKEAHIHFKMV
jgi:hypothetical protein